MTEAFRDRRFRPVAPHLRPRRSRAAARVIVTDGDSVLLLADTDPGIPGSAWWLTPGGGIDPGETPRQAAAREVNEETGLVVAATDLLGPVARRTVVHGYSDQILIQTEDFFVVHVPARFEASPAGLTAAELLTMSGLAWHLLSDLATLPQPVWPADLVALAALAHSPGAWPVDLGEIEESTLPVG